MSVFNCIPWSEGEDSEEWWRGGSDGVGIIVAVRDAYPYEYC